MNLIFPSKKPVILSEAKDLLLHFRAFAYPVPCPAEVPFRLRLPIALAIALFAATSQSQTIAITGGKLLTVSHGTIENGVLVMADGKIAAIGEAGKVKIPSGAKVV